MSCAACNSTVVTAYPSHSNALRQGAARPAGPFAWLATLMRWQERWRQRQCLLTLDDHLLMDIGLTREEALKEVQKRFWE